MTKYILLLLLLLSLKDGDVVLQLDVWGRLIYAVHGARGRRCGTACHFACLPLLVAAVRVRPSPNLPQYGRPRHCAAVVPTQPSALANCGRLSTEAAKSSICLGILDSYGHRRRDTAELRKPLRVILDIARERKMCKVGTGWNMCSLESVSDRAAGQTKPAKGGPTVPAVLRVRG